MLGCVEAVEESVAMRTDLAAADSKAGRDRSPKGLRYGFLQGLLDRVTFRVFKKGVLRNRVVFLYKVTKLDLGACSPHVGYRRGRSSGWHPSQHWCHDWSSIDLSMNWLPGPSGSLSASFDVWQPISTLELGQFRSNARPQR